MLCQKCNLNEATTLIKKNMNNITSESYLCSECAQAEDLFFKAPYKPSFFTSTPQKQSLTCKECGCSANDISKRGFAGCAECYNVFNNLLTPYIKRLHGAVEHCGKIPASMGDEFAKKRELENLRRQMDEAIKLQNFELAAEIRDKIKSNS